MSPAQTQTNYACVLTAARAVDIQNIPVPSVGPDEVLVKVEATGICGSDLHLYNHFGLGKFRVSKPSVLGHESTGTIVKIGDQVTDRAVGDRICIEPTMFCRKCFNCKAGRPNICRDIRQAGLDPTPGTLSQFYVCESDFTVKIPDSLPWLEAGCIQPLAISVQIAKRAKFSPGQTLAVFGCGPLGALVMAIAKAYGLSKILAFDISQKRVEFAKKHWAQYGTLPPEKHDRQDYESWADEFKAKVMKEAGVESWGVDVVVEASGAEPCMHAGIGFLRPDVAAGLGRAINSFPTVQIVGKELDVVGSVRYTAGCFQTAIELASSGKVDLKPLVTAKFPLSKSAEALEAVRKGDDLKVVIMNQEM
ncbi:hypothetical protein VKT23_002428 [Stygiomarasmius scandens]|uniref:Enoyl reductase (ER) domain-containing protein n=1 Tax=Marasmiellus scandens TaxID=2682957 RepID=A0ABR1K1Z7_9AGAR